MSVINESKRTRWIEAQAGFLMGGGAYGGERACIQVHDKENVLSPKKAGWDSEIFARRLNPPHDTVITFCVNLGEDGVCEEYFADMGICSYCTIYCRGVNDKGIILGFNLIVYDDGGEILMLQDLYQLRRFN